MGLRKTLHISPDTLNWLKKFQKKYEYKNNTDTSLQELADKIIKEGLKSLKGEIK